MWHGERTTRMPARAEAAVSLSGNFAARTAYADTERESALSPDVLSDWMPAFLAQLAAPGAQFVRVVRGGREMVYLFDIARESFAELTADGGRWHVRQGGPAALWDAIEEAVTAWRGVGAPDITSVRVAVTPEAHAFWIGGQRIATQKRSYWLADRPALRWKHPVASLAA